MFKPLPTLLTKSQDSVNLRTLENAKCENLKGRHDPCAVPRAVAMVEAYAALVMADHSLMHNARDTYFD